jgi:hypothetical protein
MAFAREIMGGGLSAGTSSAIGGQGGTVAATGSASTDAALVPSSICIVTAADGTKGVILPACPPGDEVWLFNNAGSTLKVYPPSGGKIVLSGTGLGTTDAAHSLLTFKTGVYKFQATLQAFVVVT